MATKAIRETRKVINANRLTVRTGNGSATYNFKPRTRSFAVRVAVFFGLLDSSIR